MDKDTSLQILVPIALAADCKTAYLGNSNYYIPNDQAYSGSYAGVLEVDYSYIELESTKF